MWKRRSWALFVQLSRNYRGASLRLLTCTDFPVNDLEVDPAGWQTGLEELLGRVAGRFGRVEPRRRAKAFVYGLLADLPRKNCWTIAEHAGDPNPDGMQHLLGRAVWDHDRGARRPPRRPR